MKLDRKLLLIAPTIVLAFIAAGLVYAAVQIRSLTAGEDTWTKRREFIQSVASGQKSLSTQQAVGLLNLSLEVESRRAAALKEAYDLVLILAAMAAGCCVVLTLGIRKVPREHWPRFARKPPAQASVATLAPSPGLES
jgi:hypothetical protein